MKKKTLFFGVNKKGFKQLEKGDGVVNTYIRTMNPFSLWVVMLDIKPIPKEKCKVILKCGDFVLPIVMDKKRIEKIKQGNCLHVGFPKDAPDVVVLTKKNFEKLKKFKKLKEEMKDVLISCI